MLLSDVSKLCFAATFVSGQNKTMNYFMCKTCSMKCKKMEVEGGMCSILCPFDLQGCVNLA